MSHTVLDGGGTLRHVLSLDAGTEAAPLRLVTMDYNAALVDMGLVFGFSGRLTLANGATIDHLITTPAAPAHCEFYVLAVDTTSSPIYADLYEGAIVSANGTNVTGGVINYNRESTRATSMTIHQSPTVTDVGSVIHSMLVSGAKSVGGGNGAEGRLVLKPSTKYLMRLVNASGASATLGIRLVFGED